MNVDRVLGARTLLFVPANRPDRFAKAAESHADTIVIDLEDAVPPQDKEHARHAVCDWLASGGQGCVRVNGPSTPWFRSDMQAIRDHAEAVVLPKTELPADVLATRNELGTEPALITLIESAKGVVNLTAICATPGVSRLAFGNGDLAAQLGVSFDDWTALLHSRSAVVVGSAAANLPPPIDGVTTSLLDQDILQRDTRRAVNLGFGGKFCIHPRQVAGVDEAFSPSQQQIEWARNIAGTARGGAFKVNGEMVDAPIVARARSILSRVERTNT